LLPVGRLHYAMKKTFRDGTCELVFVPSVCPSYSTNNGSQPPYTAEPAPQNPGLDGLRAQSAPC
jgi:hypothetical protein